jgi:large subunit ribosomal protein L4
MQVEVTTLDKASAGNAELPDDLFAAKPRADIMARVVHWQLAKRRAGTHSTKGMNDVSGRRAPAMRARAACARRSSARAASFTGRSRVRTNIASTRRCAGSA